MSGRQFARFQCDVYLLRVWPVAWRFWALQDNQLLYSFSIIAIKT